MAATVLLPATFLALRAKRLFLAVADGAQPVCGNSERDDVLLHGAGAAIAKPEVVFGGAALVAVSFDGHLNLRVVLQEIRGFRESIAGIGTNVRFVVIEICIAHFLQEELIEGGLRGRRHRRRRRIYGDARAGVGGAARTRGGDRVSSRVRGRDLGRTLGGHGAHFRRDGELRRISGIPAQGCRLTLVDGSRTGLQGYGGTSGRRRGRASVKQDSCVSSSTFSTLEFPCSSHQGHYPNTSGPGSGNISYYDIFIYRVPAWERRTQRVDQLGDSLCPAAVNWCGWEPSASMVQICRAPPRVDSKTMWRPSGAQLGRSLRP